MTDLVTTQIEDGVITIQLNRGDKKNALTGEMYHAICDGLDQLENDPALRVALIKGTEDCFTAGNDLVDFLNSSSIGGDSPVARFLRTLPNLTKPLVAAVNGPAVGVGTTMLMHCDLVYAAPGSKFQMPFANLGLCPEAGSSLLIPQLVGYRRAAELLMLCELFDAHTAKEMGFVSEVIEEDYQAYALEKAKKLARQPPASMRITKQLLRQGNQEQLKAVMAAEEKYFSEMLEAPEAKEAFNAFLEKRKPDFTQFS
ncbi:enoyl-CoA hydratase [Ketobacter sp. MCCC 1A13808]|uniref:enoyl-CoA hydratase n=1 Tax=Ketobacter sp. MCCC 1A13808 TaxID=2602738 RepID=UPI0012EB73EE|nr:enoyl-CoA hydratase [Ketobacter sp. MCCC 1A13808]MVF11117.1 enoyl-CoA hydratase [Ketobacter sp. MCCC 1A13808]